MGRPHLWLRGLMILPFIALASQLGHAERLVLPNQAQQYNFQ